MPTTPKRSVGIFLGKQTAEAVLATRYGLRAKARFSTQSFNSASPFWGADPAPLMQAFRSLAKGLSVDARRPDTRVNISLPDPLIVEERLHFKEFPTDRAQALDLVNWRYARDHHKEIADIRCSYQILNSSDQATEVLVRVAPKKIIDRAQKAARAAGFFVDRLDAWSGFWPAENRPIGARLWGDGNWWALSCWAPGDQSGLGGPGGTGDPGIELQSGWNGDAAVDVDRITRVAKTFALRAGLERLEILTNLGADVDAAIFAGLQNQEMISLVPQSGTDDTLAPRSHIVAAT